MSLERIRELLSKQQMVQGMVEGRSMPRQAIIRTLVERQHEAELQGLMDRLPAEELGEILEALSLPEAISLWKRIPEHRENEVLWELSDGRREALVGNREPGFDESQMNAFELVDGRLKQIPITGRRDLSGVTPIWIDLLNATKAERSYIGRHFGIELPDSGDATALEVSTRFRVEDNDEIHLHSNFLLDRENESRSVPVAFVLHRDMLFSLRNEDLPVFRLQRRRARTRQGYVTGCRDVLIDLYGADVEYSADALEETYAMLDQVGGKVLSEGMSDTEAAAVLGDIASAEDRNGRVRGNMLDTQRALNFLVWSKTLSADQGEDVKQILQNIDSLNNHTSFLFGKINFLMDATVGFININQNRRINHLTVFSVVFMPVNILAGIGGMSEFSMMTQGISWPFAYAGFIGMAGITGWCTYVILKHLERKRTHGRRIPERGRL